MLSLFIIFAILAGICAVGILGVVFVHDISLPSVLTCGGLIAGFITFTTLSLMQFEAATSVAMLP